MNKQELIEWKNRIEAMNSKKYVAIPAYDIIKGEMLNVSELSVLNKKECTKNVVHLIKLYYEKSILGILGSEDFDIANLYISVYLISSKNGKVNRLNFLETAEFIDDCVLVKPSVSIISKEDDEIIEIGNDDYRELLPNYVVSYNDFFEQMSNEGFDFNVCSFEKLKSEVINKNESYGVATCTVNFIQDISKRNY